MVKKNSNGRKPSGAAGIAVIDDDEIEQHEEVSQEAAEPEAAASKPERKSGKDKGDQQSNGNFGVADIRKAAAFANSVGGLDKALTLLQILKVAKEVQ